jgi:hypothetical protein
LKLSRRPNSLKSSRAHSRVNWLQEETDVSGTVPETSVFPCNQLMLRCARVDFIGCIFLSAFILFCISASAVWAYFLQIYFQTFSQNKETNLLRFQVLTAASVNMNVFWIVAPCSLVEVYRRFFQRCLGLLGEISGSHGGKYEDGCLLGCCAMQSGRSLMESASTSEKSLNFYQTTRLNNLEDNHLHVTIFCG